VNSLPDPGESPRELPPWSGQCPCDDAAEGGTSQHIARQLTDLLKNGVKFDFEKEQEHV